MSGSRPGARVVGLRFRYTTHATHSGYDRVLERIPAEVVDGERLVRSTAALPDRWFAALRAASGVARYTRRRALLELAAAPRFLFGPRRIFFHLYGDYGYRFLGALPNPRRHAIVASFHLPPAVLAATLRNPSYLSRLDRAVVLGDCQRPFFRRWLDDRKIVTIPHPVDTAYFSPGEASARERLCLFVGYYLRDLEALDRAARRLDARRPGVRIVAVVRPETAGEIGPLASLEVRSGVSDEELRALYRRASVLLLPLTDAVANNTLLEAMACGLPVVSTGVGSVSEYLGEEAGVVVPRGDGEALAAAAERFLEDRPARERASRAARARCEERFELSRVAARLSALFDEVAAG